MNGYALEFCDTYYSTLSLSDSLLARVRHIPVNKNYNMTRRLSTQKCNLFKIRFSGYSHKKLDAKKNEIWQRALVP